MDATDLSFRQMRIDDIPATLAVRLSTVENAITLEELKSDYGVTPQSIAEAMATHVRGWLCEDTGTTAGFAMGDVSSGEVLVVAVRPEYERKGVGEGVLTRVQTWLFAAGHDEIWLRANPDPHVCAYGFYRKLGWRTTGRMMDGDEVMRLRKGDSPTVGL